MMDFKKGQFVSVDIPYGRNYPWVYEISGTVHGSTGVRNFTNGSAGSNSVAIRFLTLLSYDDVVCRLAAHRDRLAVGRHPAGARPKKPFDFNARMQELAGRVK